MNRAAGEVGIVGFGEVGTALATDLLSAGRAVRCLDTRLGSATGVRARELGIEVDTSPRIFGSHVAAVLITVPGRSSIDVASMLTPSLAPGTPYFDFTAKPPSARDTILALCDEQRLSFADVAMVDPIEASVSTVELLVSGTASSSAPGLFDGTRFRVRILDPARPVSTEVKLIRSVFTKGLEALLIETLSAADRWGARAEIHRSLATFMQRDFDQVMTILVGSAIRHARRRAEEMDDAAVLVVEALGSSTMTSATADLLHRLVSLADAGHSTAIGAEEVLRVIDRHLFAPIKAPREAGPRE